jgi:hypothetical protein
MKGFLQGNANANLTSLHYVYTLETGHSPLQVSIIPGFLGIANL